jgi:hypothetical protein
LNDHASRLPAHAASARRTAASIAGAREWAGLAVLALPTVLLGLDVTRTLEGRHPDRAL